MNDDSYLQAASWKDSQMKQVLYDYDQLNKLHDQVYSKVLEIAIHRVSIHLGPPPSSFTFFVMGSAGRLEQSVLSDQDHGIIYQDSQEEVKHYFLALGKELSKGLYQTGYPYCDGGVMASNPFWCKSLLEWKQQLTKWIVESSWESIRYLLIFIDARTIFGRDEYVLECKKHIYQTVNQGHFHEKLLNNTMYVKKGMNVLGQLLVDTHGRHAGALNIKETGLLPYINAARLIAIKENLLETSTLSRLKKVPEVWMTESERDVYSHHFEQLLTYRLRYGDSTNYDSGHYLPIHHLSREQTKELKNILKNGAALYQTVRRFIEKDDFYGDE